MVASAVTAVVSALHMVHQDQATVDLEVTDLALHMALLDPEMEASVVMEVD